MVQVRLVMSWNYPDRRKFMALAGAYSVHPVFATSKQQTIDNLKVPKQLANDAIASSHVPSLSVAVLRHGKPVWIEAFGLANRELQVEANPHTRYAIASATKPFTATALVNLVTQQRLSLADPVVAHFPETGANSEALAGVTVADILQHRSGIPRHWRNFFKGQGAPPPFLDVVRTHAFATSAHGHRYLYSNLNYGLAAYIIEQKTGTEYHRYLAENVLRPLGLTSATSLGELTGSWSAAIPYEDDRTPIPPYLVDEKGARDLVMTATDLARFGEAHLSRLRHNAGVSQMMLAERAAMPEEGIARRYYGLGWMIEEDTPAALFNFGHTGEGPGASSSLTIVPSESLVVATLANAQGAPAYQINEAIVDALCPEFAVRRKVYPFEDAVSDLQSFSNFAGEWIGEIETADGPVRVKLALRDASSSQVFLSGGPAVPVTQVTIKSGLLNARIAAQIPCREATSFPHSLRMQLERAGERLTGSIAAYAPKGSTPHDQFWISYKMRLDPMHV